MGGFGLTVKSSAFSTTLPSKALPATEPSKATDFFYIKKLKSQQKDDLSDAQLRTKRAYDDVYGETKKALGYRVLEH